MDPTLQKRLIGASVLIVLAVIFVPMLLDGAGERGAESLPLAIPAMPERDFETREVPLDLPVATAPAGVAEAIGVAPAHSESTPTTDPVPVQPDAVAAVDTQAPVRVDAVSGDVTGAQAKPVAANPPAVAAATAPAPAAAPANLPTPASGRFLIGLGSYANAANAQALAAQLRGGGFKVLSDQVAVNGQQTTRLRIGPYATRGQAEAARLEVRRLRADLPATISETDDTPASDAPAIARSAAATSVWAVQVGAFKLEAEANAKRDQLRQAGFAAFVEKINAEAGVLWRVRIGPENKRADADAVKAGVKRRFGIDGIVVPYP